MSADPRDLKNPQRRLPQLVLPAAGAGPGRNVRSAGRLAPVLVLVHGAGCEQCRVYVDDLAAAGTDVRDWDGEIIIVAPHSSAAAIRPATPGVTHLQDAEGRLRKSLDVPPPAVVIADQWGEIRALEPAGDNHRFLAVAEVVEWLRFLAIECPECQGEVF